MEKQKVAIVILNFNGREHTLECLGSITNLNLKSIALETLVVDNASKDNSVKAIRKYFPKIKIIENKKNLGFCEGNNVGITKSLTLNPDFVLILNNDTIVNPSLVSQLIKSAYHHNADLLSPKIYFAKGYEFHKSRYKKNDLGKVIWYAGGQIDWRNILTSHRGVDQVDHGQFNKAEETDYLTGCAMFVKTKVFKKIGLFDPLFFAYFEDADFSQRAKRAGFRLIFAPKAILWHKNAASFRGSGSDFQDFFITRNRILFAFRYAPFRAKLALAKQSMWQLIKAKDVKKQAILSAFKKEKIDHKKIHKLLRL